MQAITSLSFWSEILPDTYPAIVTMYHGTYKGKQIDIQEMDYNNKKDYTVFVNGENKLWTTEKHVKKDLENLLNNL